MSMFATHAQQMPADYDQAMKTLGKQGDFKDNVLKVNIPRDNVRSQSIDRVPDAIRLRSLADYKR